MSVLDPLVLSENPQLDDALILRMQYDLATGMHNSEVIARRYGLDGTNGLKDYLRQHPTIVNEARRLRALFMSDEATEGRIRTKFLRATEDLIIPMTALVADPRTPIAQRIDGFKQIQRGAGVDGAPAAAAREAKTGTAFNLTINFTGVREQQISGTVLEADDLPGALPVVPGRLGLTAEDVDEDLPEEDV